MSHWIFVTRYPAEEGKTTAHEHVHYIMCRANTVNHSLLKSLGYKTSSMVVLHLLSSQRLPSNRAPNFIDDGVYQTNTYLPWC